MNKKNILILTLSILCLNLNSEKKEIESFIMNCSKGILAGTITLIFSTGYTCIEQIIEYNVFKKKIKKICADYKNKKETKEEKEEIEKTFSHDETHCKNGECSRYISKYYKFCKKLNPTNNAQEEYLVYEYFKKQHEECLEKCKVPVPINWTPEIKNIFSGVTKKIIALAIFNLISDVL